MRIALHELVNTWIEAEPSRAVELPTTENAPTVFAHPVKIWLIDDDDQLRDLIAEVINNYDGLVCENGFASPEAALNALGSNSAPDVVLLDINLGQADGIQIIRPLKSRAPATDVLMLTTFFDSVSETKAFEAGASGFLLKSYEPEQIVQAIRDTHSNRSRPRADHSSLWPSRANERSLSTTTNPPRQECRSRKRGFLRGLLSLLAL
jgi:DNA-binding NarL/FixJ family response regulator